MHSDIHEDSEKAQRLAAETDDPEGALAESLGESENRETNGPFKKLHEETEYQVQSRRFVSHKI